MFHNLLGKFARGLCSESCPSDDNGKGKEMQPKRPGLWAGGIGRQEVVSSLKTERSDNRSWRSED